MQVKSKKKAQKTRSRFDIFMLFYSTEADCIFEEIRQLSKTDSLKWLTLVWPEL